MFGCMEFSLKEQLVKANDFKKTVFSSFNKSGQSGSKYLDTCTSIANLKLFTIMTSNVHGHVPASRYVILQHY